MASWVADRVLAADDVLVHSSSFAVFRLALKMPEIPLVVVMPPF